MKKVFLFANGVRWKNIPLQFKNTLNMFQWSTKWVWYMKLVVGTMMTAIDLSGSKDVDITALEICLVTKVTHHGSWKDYHQNDIGNNLDQCIICLKSFFCWVCVSSEYVDADIEDEENWQKRKEWTHGIFDTCYFHFMIFHWLFNSHFFCVHHIVFFHKTNCRSPSIQQSKDIFLKHQMILHQQ